MKRNACPLVVSWLYATMLGCALVGVTVGGCSSKQATPAVNITDAVERLYETYLNGSGGEARKALHETLRLDEQIKSPHGRASAFAWTYSRLHALEMREGHPDIAEVHLIKARYWFVCDAELGKRSEADIAATMRAFTPDACITMVDNWDKKHSNGMGAKYMQKADGKH